MEPRATRRALGELVRAEWGMTHAVAVVVEEDALILGRLAQLMAQLLCVLECRVEVLQGKR